MTWQRQSLGRRGEELAKSFLEQAGYRILARNYRTQNAELDLVALDLDQLVFVEVKSRNSLAFGSPLEAITRRKQNKIVLAANEYLIREKAQGVAARFDVVAIIFSNGKTSVEHIKNAFELA